MAPEAHQNDHSYVCELSQSTTQEFSMVGGYTEDLKKKHKTVKLGGWALMQGWPLAQDNAFYDANTH